MSSSDEDTARSSAGYDATIIFFSRLTDFTHEEQLALSANIHRKGM
jgi:hypothetical protein